MWCKGAAVARAARKHVLSLLFQMSEMRCKKFFSVSKSEACIQYVVPKPKGLKQSGGVEV